MPPGPVRYLNLRMKIFPSNLLQVVLYLCQLLRMRRGEYQSVGTTAYDIPARITGASTVCHEDCPES